MNRHIGGPKVVQRRALPADWRARLAAGERRTLARLLTEVENETAAGETIVAALASEPRCCPVVGFTGAPGVGKSTLVNAYVGELRRRGQTVGVVAVDPSSPRSGGAILGDRIRLSAHAGDAGVFVRSAAARGHLGGLTRTTARIVDVMAAAGSDVLVVETVGTGQSELEITGVATTNVVVSAPGMGDDLQALKAGVLEIADVLVVNKADQMPPAAAVAQLEEAARRATHSIWTVPVVATTATSGAGVAELADAIARHAGAVRPEAPARRRLRQRLREQMRDLAQARAAAVQDADLDALERALADGTLTLRAAAEALLRGEPLTMVRR